MNAEVQRARASLHDLVSQCAQQSLASISVLLPGVESTIADTHFSSRERSLFEGDGVLLQTSYRGPVRGRLGLVLRTEPAATLAGLMIGSEDPMISPVGQAALLELTNIVTSGFLTALSQDIGAQKPLIPEPPTIHQGILDRLVVTQLLEGDHTLCLATDFVLQPQDIRGRFAAALSEKEACQLLQAVGLPTPAPGMLHSGWHKG